MTLSGLLNASSPPLRQRGGHTRTSSTSNANKRRACRAGTAGQWQQDFAKARMPFHCLQQFPQMMESRPELYTLKPATFLLHFFFIRAHDEQLSINSPHANAPIAIIGN